MSNIIKQKEDLLILKDFITQIDKKEVTPNDIKEFTKLLLPKKDNKQLIEQIILPYGKAPACFDPQIKSIIFSMYDLKKYIRLTTDIIVAKYETRDENPIRNYLYLCAILHEIEHSYQYLMGEGIIEAPNNLIKDGYHNLYNMPYNEYNLIQRIQIELSIALYNKHCNSLILERNAQIETDDALCQLALLENKEHIYEIFLSHKNEISQDGYKKNTSGSLEETYRKILIYKTYKQFDKNIDCSEEERIRWGLNISEEARQKVLSLPTKPKDIRKF